MHHPVVLKGKASPSSPAKGFQEAHSLPGKAGGSLAGAALGPGSPLKQPSASPNLRKEASQILSLPASSPATVSFERSLLPEPSQGRQPWSEASSEAFKESLLRHGVIRLPGTVRKTPGEAASGSGLFSQIFAQEEGPEEGGFLPCKVSKAEAFPGAVSGTSCLNKVEEASRDLSQEGKAWPSKYLQRPDPKAQEEAWRKAQEELRRVLTLPSPSSQEGVPTLGEGFILWCALRGLLKEVRGLRRASLEEALLWQEEELTSKGYASLMVLLGSTSFLFHPLTPTTTEASYLGAYYHCREDLRLTESLEEEGARAGAQARTTTSGSPEGSFTSPGQETVLKKEALRQELKVLEEFWQVTQEWSSLVEAHLALALCLLKEGGSLA